MRRSPLHDLHHDLGARFVDFGGWETPLQYTSVLAEHRAVRDDVGVFDVTHLGRFRLTGQGAHDALRRRFCNDIERIEPGRCQYTMMLNPDGGIVDDLIIWWWEEGDYWVMPNADNHERVMAEIGEEPGCEIEDLRETTVFLAVQGPGAPALIERLVGTSPRRYRNTVVEWDATSLRMAGTGYTGEAGAEICVPAGIGEDLFRALLKEDAVPCGLGARDTLRLEAGLALWGEDIDETTTPTEAGLGFAVSLEHDFVGKDVVERETAEGPARRLSGFVLDGRGIPRHGYPIRTNDGGEGTVTSGNLSPVLQTGVGLGYISPPPGEGSEIGVLIRDRWVPGHVVTPPFHKAG